MSANRRAALVAGLLYLLGTVAGIFSVAPSVDGTDYLVSAAANATQILLAACSQLVMVPAYVGIAIVLYPLLKRHDETLALGFIGFRIIAGAFTFIGVIMLLLLLTLSQEFVRRGTPGASHFQTLGELLRTGRDLANHVGMILALSIGALPYYALLFRAKLVPRWLSAWGLVGAALAVTASLLFMFRLFDVVTPAYLLLNAPMGLQELVLAIWLIARGFNPSALEGAFQ